MLANELRRSGKERKSLCIKIYSHPQIYFGLDLGFMRGKICYRYCDYFKNKNTNFGKRFWPPTSLLITRKRLWHSQRLLKLAVNVFSGRGCLYGAALTRRGICGVPAAFTHQPLLNGMLWAGIGRGVGFCTFNSTALCGANFVMKALKMFLTCCRKGLPGGSSCIYFHSVSFLITSDLEIFCAACSESLW